MGLATGEQNLVLNVDDGRIAGRDHIWVQGSCRQAHLVLRLLWSKKYLQNRSHHHIHHNIKYHGGGGSPCVNPLFVLKSIPRNLIDFGTKRCLSQWWAMRRAMFCPIPYPLRISMHQPLSRELYTFRASRNSWNRGSCAIPPTVAPTSTPRSLYQYPSPP